MRLLTRPKTLEAIFVVLVVILFFGIAKDQRERAHALFAEELVTSARREAINLSAMMAAHVQQVFEHSIGAMVYMRDREAAEILLRGPVYDALDRQVRSIARSSSIIKVKLFSLDGYTVYSTSRADLGQHKYTDAFDRARSGTVASLIERRARFSALDGERRDIDVVSTYMPMRWIDDPENAAILEFYFDVTESVARSRISERRLAALFAVGLGALFVILLALAVGAARVVSASQRRSEQLDAAHRAIDAQFREGIESMIDAFIMISVDGRVARWNSRYVEMFPYLAPILQVGLPIRDLMAAHASSASYAIPEAERGTWLATALREAFLDTRGAIRRQLADGRVLSGAVTHAPGGAAIHVIRDVTAEAIATAELARSEARFRDGIDAISEGFVLLDSDSKVAAWNRAFEELFPGQQASLGVGEPFHDVERDGIESRCHRTSSGGTVVVYRDVTAERRAYQALAESERRFRDFAETTADWFWELDDQFRFKFLSDSSFAITGQAREQLYGQRPQDYRPDGVSDAAWREHLETLEAYLPFRDFRFRTLDPNGASRHVSVSALPVFAEDGRFQGYRGVGKDITSLVESETALAAAKSIAEHSESMFRDGMDSMVDGFIMFDAENRVAKWNSRYVALFPHVADRIRAGLPARELLEMHAASPLYAIPEAERARWVDEALSYKPGEQTDFKRVLSDGRVLRVTGTTTAGGGEIYVIADITAETSAKDALAESEAKFRDFAEIASDWFWETDAEDRFTYVSADIGRVGLTSSEIVGRRGEELASRDQETPRDIDAIRVAMADRASFRNFEYRVRVPNGPDRMLSISGRPVFTADGDFVGYRGTGRDVSELHASRARLEAALADLRTSRDEARRLALVAQHTDSAVIITDAAGAIEWVNPGFTRISGYSLDEIRGRVPGHVLRSPKTDPETVTRIRGALARGEGFHAELVNRTKDGRDYWLEIDCAPVLGDDGGVEHFIAIEADITGRKEQERRIAEALERERTAAAQQKRFVAIAAHEFRTPLTIIDGAAQRMIRNADRVAPGDLRERAQKIRGAVARMSQLVDTTLNSARLDEGQIDINFSKVDIIGLVATVCRRQETISAGFVFSVTSNVASFAIKADARLLDQVFTNLIANAVKYSGGVRRVDIALACEAATVRVSVRDYGIGVPSDEIPNLFTRFFRASTARGLPGTGIGLNLVKELVALHHGDVTVESEVGRGSTFIVTLPVESDRTRAVARGPVAA